MEDTTWGHVPDNRPPEEPLPEEPVAAQGRPEHDWAGGTGPPPLPPSTGTAATAGTPGPRPRVSRRVLAGAGIAVVVVGGAAGAAAAATSHPSHPAGTGSPAGRWAAGSVRGDGGMGDGRAMGGGVTGIISAVNGSTLTVTRTSGGSVTVTTTGSTSFLRSQASSVAAIAAGDHVTVMPERTSSSSANSTAVTADRISDTGTGTLAGAGPGSTGPGGTGSGGTGPGGMAGGGPMGGHGPVSGTVRSISGSTLTVSEASGTVVTVSTNASTAVERLSSITLADLAAGQKVSVMGSGPLASTSGTVTATRVVEGDVTAPAGPGDGDGPPDGGGPGAGDGLPGR